MKIFILYPNQLFKNISNFVDKKVLLVEEPLFFTQYDFHIQKLILHRASMKFYESYLKQKNIPVEYFEDESYLELYKDEEIFVYELFDNYLEKKFIKTFQISLQLKTQTLLTQKIKTSFYINFI
ncbi:cryptochrome/photolyase family protein [Aliarcobacter cryaerophilus]|uniref:Cryptochrome/photolyase family protein n=1 Tax=Arcobacter sp. AZ-2023 TaxID=3074453 RepID=A0AA96CVG2_9BACT|nr:cryptochrome/photolyase family protein [Arcobacter sp. AZ-2023]